VIVLGVDPSTVATGWAILDGDSRRARAVDYGVLRPPSGAELPKRLSFIYTGLTRVVEHHDPEVVALESAFLARNVKTALALGQVRGIVLLTASQRGLGFEEYSALEIKRSAVGYGGAKKEQTIKMMQSLLGLPAPPLEDEADALATAWCHLTRAARPIGTMG
jgi:crossover junction endodeoxyribonuclease RuvC